MRHFFASYASWALTKRTRPQRRRMGRFTRPKCERVRRKETSVPKMRAGSHGRHVREPKRSECERARTNANFQNAGGHARTPPRKIDAPRMRADPHKRHLGQTMQAERNASTPGRISPRRASQRDPQESMRVALKAVWNRSSNFSSNFFYEAKVIEKKIGWKIG